MMDNLNEDDPEWYGDPDDCNSTAECPSSDSHYKGCPILDLPKGIGVEW